MSSHDTVMMSSRRQDCAASLLKHPGPIKSAARSNAKGIVRFFKANKSSICFALRTFSGSPLSKRTSCVAGMTPGVKAWVVFSGQADLAWLKILKPGFRHCAVLMNDGRNWITIDPLSNYTDVTVHHVPLEFDLPLWMKDRGHKVVPAPIERVARPAPFAVYSCVEAVKRVLGIHRRLILTPWQLYRYLTRLQTAQTFNPKGDFAWEV